MAKLKYVIVVVFVLSLIACDKETTKTESKVIEPLVIGVLNDGKIYFESQCGSCHSAGDDRSTAFGAIDLAQSHDRIKSDMSDLGGVNVSGIIPLMGRFKNVPAQRVADLKVYFSSLN